MITITENWEIEAGVDANTGLNYKYVVDAPIIQTPRAGVDKPKIVVHLRKQYYNSVNGNVVKDEVAGYEIVRGVERTYYDSELMPKLDADGNVMYEDDGEGNQVPVLGRTDSYERIIYALENGLFTKDILLDGIKEYYKLT